MQSVVYHLAQKLEGGSGLFPFPLQTQVMSPYCGCTAFGAQTQHWLFPTLCGSASSGIVFSNPTVLCRPRLRCLTSCVCQAMPLSLCVSVSYPQIMHYSHYVRPPFIYNIKLQCKFFLTEIIYIIYYIKAHLIWCQSDIFQKLEAYTGHTVVDGVPQFTKEITKQSQASICVILFISLLS